MATLLPQSVFSLLPFPCLWDKSSGNPGSQTPECLSQDQLGLSKLCTSPPCAHFLPCPAIPPRFTRRFLHPSSIPLAYLNPFPSATRFFFIFCLYYYYFLRKEVFSVLLSDIARSRPSHPLPVFAWQDWTPKILPSHCWIIREPRSAGSGNRGFFIKPTDISRGGAGEGKINLPTHKPFFEVLNMLALSQNPLLFT